MPYHLMIWPSDSREQMGGELWGFNLTEEQLRERILKPYEEGGAITWNGRTLTSLDHIQISFTDSDILNQTGHELEAFESGSDVTNDWVTGPPGARRSAEAVLTDVPEQRLDPKRVMVVYGRNEAARVAMFHFLRALGLQPIEWEAAIRETGMGAPHNLDAVRAAMDIAQAVVVVLTAEDQAGLLPALADEGEEDVALRGQPRQNVILEAGLAMGVSRERTILVEMGPIRRASDFEGLNAVRMSNANAKRTALKTRLETAGCELDDSGGADWLEPESGGEFEGCVVDWKPADTQPADTEAAAEREARAIPAPENVSRADYHQARIAQLEERLDKFLDVRREIDQPFSELDLVAAIADKKFDEVAAIRTLRQLHQEGRVYPNPDGDGWYPSAAT